MLHVIQANVMFPHLILLLLLVYSCTNRINDMRVGQHTILEV